MTITAITVIHRRHGTDIIYFDTDLPDAVHPYIERLSLMCYAAKDTGEAYVKTHFPTAPFTVKIWR